MNPKYLFPFLSNVEKDQCANNLAETKQKGFKRRYIYGGWNNYTDFELSLIN